MHKAVSCCGSFSCMCLCVRDCTCWSEEAQFWLNCANICNKHAWSWTSKVQAWGSFCQSVTVQLEGLVTLYNQDTESSEQAAKMLTPWTPFRLKYVFLCFWQIWIFTQKFAVFPVVDVLMLCICSPQMWDYELERSAEYWAHMCRWEHGPNHMLTQIGQNLGVHWGRCVWTKSLILWRFTFILRSPFTITPSQL